MLLQGKVALISGAGQGLGQGVALGFAREGSAVAICDINQEAALKTAEIITKDGGKALGIGCDVANASQAQQAVAECVKHFGRLDILANIAGISPKKGGRKIPFYEIPSEQWDRVIAVNLSSCMYLSAAAAPHMIAQKSGRIINMSSIAGKTGSEWGPAGAHYYASKAGVIGLTRAMAFELAPFQITVNAVAPGRIQSTMAADTADDINQSILARIPMGRFGTIAEVADLFIFLASDKAAYITGEITDINGGWLID